MTATHDSAANYDSARTDDSAGTDDSAAADGWARTDEWAQADHRARTDEWARADHRARTDDWAGISELVHRYAALVDRRDLDAAAALFVDDAELVLPMPPTSLAPVRRLTGRAEIRAGLNKVYDSIATLHGVLAVAVDRRDGAVTGTVTAVAHHLVAQPTGGAVDFLWHFRYRDHYRLEHGWRFARRELWIDWTETRPVTVGGQDPRDR